MEIRFEKRDGFCVCGYAVETILSSSEDDVGQLWSKNRDNLLALSEDRVLYGVMWYTENHRYYYLLGVRSDCPPHGGMTATQIPAAHFAVATVPADMTETEAWTSYFDKELPVLGYIPDAGHGKYFEFYRADDACELWTPVIADLLVNLDKVHTTEMGLERIRKNLGLDDSDTVEWCKRKIASADSIIKKGKNWYVSVDGVEITVNAHSYTIITAHKAKGG